MRLIKFLLVFLGVAVLVVGSIFWINRDTFLTVFQNRPAIMEGSEWVEKTYSMAGLIEFMAEQPQHAAVVSVPVSEYEDRHQSHSSENREMQAIRYRSDRMYPSGTLSNLMLFITYADLVISGSLDPDAGVDTDKLFGFYLTGLDRRHERTFRRWLRDRESQPTADALVRFLVRHNDPAVADYLFFFLGEEEVTKRTSRLGAGRIEPPVPQFGLRMAALQPENTRPIADNLALANGLERSAFLDEALAISRQQWQQVREFPEVQLSSFQDQRVLHGLYPRIQPDHFAGLLESIWSGTLIYEPTSDLLRDLLQRSSDDRLLEPHITHYAAQFDERMSYMSGWSVAVKTKSEPFRVQIVLLVDIPAGLWFHMNSNFMVQDLHNRMIYDPAIQERMFELLMESEVAGRAGVSLIPNR